MNWLVPTDNHSVYEALTVIADQRAEFISENELHCVSSSGGKFYTVTYDPTTKAIMSNDNMAYYVGKVSYPMIVMLMLKNELAYPKELLPLLAGVKWKDINQSVRNDYPAGVRKFLETFKDRTNDRAYIETEINKIYKQLLRIKLIYLGEKKVPPNAY